MNMFGYCLNNPIMHIDTTGNAPEDITRALASLLLRSPIYNLATKQGWFPELFYIAGFYRDSAGVYHTRQDCWQQIFGYNDFYDTVFHYGTSMLNKKFPFKFKGKNFILWAWKGDYMNLGAGAELGIYSQLGSIEHYLAETAYAMPMKMTLTLTCNKNKIKIIDYDPKKWQTHEQNTDKWWVTGFNPYY